MGGFEIHHAGFDFNPMRLGQLVCLFEADFRNIPACHIKPLGGQKHAVAALAHSEVQGLSLGQKVDVVLQKCYRFFAEDVGFLLVFGIPAVLVAGFSARN